MVLAGGKRYERNEGTCDIKQRHMRQQQQRVLFRTFAARRFALLRTNANAFCMSLAWDNSNRNASTVYEVRLELVRSGADDMISECCSVAARVRSTVLFWLRNVCAHMHADKIFIRNTKAVLPRCCCSSGGLAITEADLTQSSE